MNSDDHDPSRVPQTTHFHQKSARARLSNPHPCIRLRNLPWPGIQRATSLVLKPHNARCIHCLRELRAPARPACARGSQRPCLHRDPRRRVNREERTAHTRARRALSARLGNLSDKRVRNVSQDSSALSHKRRKRVYREGWPLPCSGVPHTQAHPTHAHAFPHYPIPRSETRARQMHLSARSLRPENYIHQLLPAFPDPPKKPEPPCTTGWGRRHQDFLSFHSFFFLYCFPSQDNNDKLASCGSGRSVP